MNHKHARLHRERLQELLNRFMEERDYANRDTDGHVFFSVNVKRHNDYVDIEDLAESYPEEYRSAILENCDETWVSVTWEQWIEDCCEQLLYELSGALHSSPDYWEGLRAKIRAGEDTGYPNIRAKRTVNTRLALVDGWERREKEEAEHFSVIDQKSMGFYGRSGGHFCFDLDVSIEDDLENAMMRLEDVIKYDELDAITAGECRELEKEARSVLESIAYIKKYVADYNAAMSFEDEVRFRIDSGIIEPMEAEARRAKDAEREAINEEGAA